MSHPIEALLRPPVELWSSAVAMMLATLALVAPWALMMPPGIAWSAAAALGMLAPDRPCGYCAISALCAAGRATGCVPPGFP
jgi:hypothetical protein